MRQEGHTLYGFNSVLPLNPLLSRHIACISARSLLKSRKRTYRQKAKRIEKLDPQTKNKSLCTNQTIIAALRRLNSSNVLESNRETIFRCTNKTRWSLLQSFNNNIKERPETRRATYLLILSKRLGTFLVALTFLVNDTQK